MLTEDNFYFDINAPYSKKTAQGYPIVDVVKDKNNRHSIIAYQEATNHYVIGYGYHCEDGHWENGDYDFKEIRQCYEACAKRGLYPIGLYGSIMSDIKYAEHNNNKGMAEFLGKGGK